MDKLEYVQQLVGEVYNDLEEILGADKMPDWFDYEGVTINPRLTRAIARCIQRQCYGSIAYRFDVSPRFLCMKYEVQRNIIAHEWIHAMCGLTEHHGKQYRWYMNYINEHSDYKITLRTDISADIYDAPPPPVREAKYILRCTNCGKEWYYHRMCAIVQNAERYMHKACGNGNICRVK